MSLAPLNCFKYSVLAGLYTGDVVGQITWSDLHQYRNRLTFDGLGGSAKFMPVTSIKFGEFEEKNSILVNVYGYEDEDVFPVYVRKRYQNPDLHVNLLLLCPQNDAEEDEIRNFNTIGDHRTGHYCVIKNMSRLISSQLGTEQVYVCMRCLTTNRSAEALTEHERLCSLDEEAVRCVMPEGQKWLKFRNYGKLMRVSFVIVATFECSTVPPLANDVPTHGHEVQERRLDPIPYSYVRISVDNSYPQAPVYYRGTDPDDTMGRFLSDMAREEDEAFAILSATAPMAWCDEGLANMEASNVNC